MLRRLLKPDSNDYPERAVMLLEYMETNIEESVMKQLREDNEYERLFSAMENARQHLACEPYEPMDIRDLDVLDTFILTPHPAMKLRSHIVKNDLFKHIAVTKSFRVPAVYELDGFIRKKTRSVKVYRQRLYWHHYTEKTEGG